MAEVNVRQAVLDIITVKLSKKLIKQIRKLDWQYIQNNRATLLEGNDFKADVVIGWIHGSAVDGDDWKKWLLICTGDHEYGLVDVMESTARKFKQIYIA